MDNHFSSYRCTTDVGDLLLIKEMNEMDSVTVGTQKNYSQKMLENYTEYGMLNGTDYYDGYFDLSNMPYPGEKKTVALWQALLKVCLCSNLIILSVLGNSLIILVVIYNKRLRTTTNYYIVNLAVADLLVTVSCSWVALVDDLTEGWVLGRFFCKFNSFAQVTSLVSSILSLMLIACDRFFGIVYAMKAHIIERRACHSIVLIWLFSIGVGIPLLIYRDVFERKWQDHTERWCDDTWPLKPRYVTEDGIVIHFQPSRLAYWTCVTFLLYFIPLIVMSFAYCGVIKTLWTSKVPGERIPKDVNIQTKVKRKVVIMLVLIMVVFGVCWLPLQITVLYAEYKDPVTRLEDWYEDVTFYSRVLAFSNSAINPIIYAGFNDNFRKGFKIMFGCYKKKRYDTLTKTDDSFHSSTTVTTSFTRI